MFISKKKAVKLLRENAGYTIAAAKQAVDALPAKTFGKREKVKKADVNRIISDANRPTPVPESATKIRPFQKRVIAQIRASR